MMEKYKVVKDTELYSDFHPGFLSHPDTGRLLRKTNVEAIKAALKTLLLTDKQERPFSDIGSDIRKSLFEPFSPQSEHTIKQRVIECIEAYEPRCKLQEVFVQADVDRNAYQVKIVFVPLGRSDLETLDVRITRLR